MTRKARPIKIYPPILDAEIAADNLRAWLPDEVTVTASGSWVYLSGRTILHKEKIKEIGGQWCPGLCAWAVKDFSLVPDTSEERGAAAADLERAGDGGEYSKMELRRKLSKIILDNGGIKYGRGLAGEILTDVPLHLRRRDGLHLDELIGEIGRAGIFGQPEYDTGIIEIIRGLWAA